MLVWSKELGMLGVKKEDFPFTASHGTTLDGKRGVVPCQTWNLDFTLACELYQYIRAFRTWHAGHPVSLTPTQWEKILDEMADGFGEYIKRVKQPDGRSYECVEHKLNRSLALLREWWWDLWW